MITTGIGRSSSIARAASIPSIPGMRTSSSARSGVAGARQLDRLDAVARLGHHVESGPAEHGGEVEADDRLVLGDQDAAGNRATAFPPCVGAQVELARELVAHERARDRQAEPVDRALGRAGAAVGDREHDVGAVACRARRRSRRRRARPRSRTARRRRARAPSPGLRAAAPAASVGMHRAGRPGRCPASPAAGRSGPAQSTPSTREEVSRSCTSAIEQMRFTLSRSAFSAAGPPAEPELQPQQRRHGLQVVLDPVVDLLGEQAAQRGAARLDRRGALVGDGRKQRELLRRPTCAAGR